MREIRFDVAPYAYMRAIFRLRPDGSGVCLVEDNEIDVTHTLVLDEIVSAARENGAIRDEDDDGVVVIAVDFVDALEMWAYDAFSEQVNPMLDDPFVSRDALVDERLRFAVGEDDGTMERLIELAQTFYSLLDPSAGEYETIICAATEELEMGFGDCDTTPEALEPLIFAITDHMKPYGFSWQVNDGPTHRESGYNLNPSEITVQTEERPAREAVQAERRLIEEAAAIGLDLTAHVGALNAQFAPAVAA